MRTEPHPERSPQAPPATRPAGVQAALAALWQQAGLPADELAALQLTAGPGQPLHAAVLPSSFCIADAAQASLAAAGLAALQLGRLRGGPAQRLALPREAALLGCSAHLLIDGVAPPLWDKVSGLYRCGEAAGLPGWVRIHGNFAHHRDAALRVLGLPEGEATGREAVAQALRSWAAEPFETAVAEAGGVAAAARSPAQWWAHPQGRALRGQPLLQWRRTGDAPPRPWPAWGAAAHPGCGPRPLDGLRVLDLTRILAGPVGGRLLASFGAEVLMVNGPHLPNIAHIADLSRGKRSAQLDLRQPAQRAQLLALAASGHVLLQGYRPGALAAHGLAPEALAQQAPGLVVATLSAWGAGPLAPEPGPWAQRRGFDSLVQTATGFNLDEAAAAGSDTPRAMPVQILDYCAGHLLAFGIQVALRRQATEGGSWQVDLSLARVAEWLRGLGRLLGDGDGPGGAEAGLAAVAPPLAPLLQTVPSGFGTLTVLREALQFSATPAALPLPAMPPGSHPAAWAGVDPRVG